MCGIWSYIQLLSKPIELAQLFKQFNRLKHRGPDMTRFETYQNVVIGFHRLAIMDPTFRSNQPFILEDDDHTVICICNGEIYNFKEIIKAHGLHEGKNDCMVLPEVYVKMLKEGKEADFNSFIMNEVKGEFAFVLFEFDRMKHLKTLVVGRDEVGIRPLYYTPYKKGVSEIVFTSEMKGFPDKPLSEFPPGHLMTYTFSELDQVNVHDYDYSRMYQVVYGRGSSPAYFKSIVQTSVINSVRRRLTADQPFAFLLSGGVDSSLVAALSAKILGKPIRTFCCGMQEGTDLQYARQVAKHIGSQHTEVFFTPEEGLAAIHDVIYTIESWDTTSVRASVGQYLVSKYIGLNTDCKVVMVGEGPDEVCSSYLFNWYAPDGKALDQAAKDYVRNIHHYDVKRADRCIARWGLEGRVPLLDPEFIAAYWKIPGEQRMPVHKGMEKWWLRDAFANTGLLPDTVLWRKKEAFSDGVSGTKSNKSWFQIIQEWVEDKVTDEELANAATTYPYCTPSTKEAYYYRKVFCQHFELQQTIIPGYWQPKWSSDGTEITDYIDPSARVLDIYNQN